MTNHVTRATLVELMVGMALMTIVGAMGVTYFISLNTNSARTASDSFVGATARVAMRAITTALQYADSPGGKPGFPDGRFETATTGTLVFYSNVAANRAPTANGPHGRTAPAKIAFTVTGGNLVETTYLPKSSTVPDDYTTNYASTPTSRLVLITGIGNTEVFTYCSPAGDPALAATFCSKNRTTDAMKVGAASISSVTVQLVVPGRSGDPAQTLQSSVSITGALA